MLLQFPITSIVNDRASCSVLYAFSQKKYHMKLVYYTISENTADVNYTKSTLFRLDFTGLYPDNAVIDGPNSQSSYGILLGGASNIANLLCAPIEFECFIRGNSLTLDLSTSDVAPGETNSNALLTPFQMAVFTFLCEEI